MKAFNEPEYTDTQFEKLVLPGLTLKHKIFDHCRFKDCVFREGEFENSRFNECTFEHCDIALSSWKGTALNEVSFNHVNLTGVNWTELQWPLVKLASPLYFDSCNLSYGSFFSLSLPDLLMERSKAHECDFREANLTQASFAETDLQGSMFMHTQLSHANFVDAINYHIDTRENNIKFASFSFPDVIALLHCQEINIVGYDKD